MSTTSPREVVPELGPLLGRLADPAVGPTRGLALDDVRFALLSELFELGGAARQFAAEGDVAAAASSLGRHGLLEAWERAGAVVAARVTERIDARLRGAAAESRLPRRRLARLLLDDEERRAISVRLGVAGGPFVVALDALEHTVPGVGRTEAGLDAAGQPEDDALGHVARRLEVAWERLSAAAGDEEAAWDAEIERVRQWRRPRWPLWAITAMVFGVALYLGLVLGGFVPVPGVLRPFAEYWWSR